MATTDENSRPAQDLERGQDGNTLPDRSRPLALLVLVLVAGGVGIPLLLGYLGPIFGSCLLAVWAAGVIAAAAALGRRVCGWWSTRHRKAPELQPPEGGNSLPLTRPELGSTSDPASAAHHKRKSRLERRLIVRWVTIRDEDKD
jgi:hypothetical protein